MKEEIILANNKILAKIVAKNKTENGLILPSDDKSENQIAIVAKKHFSKGITLDEGDIIYYIKYTGDALKIEDEEYLILKEEDVLCYTRKTTKNI